MLLLKRGADIRARDKDGRDVHIKAAGGVAEPQLVAYLLAKNALMGTKTVSAQGDGVPEDDK